MPKNYISSSTKETKQIANDFAKKITTGRVLCLVGDLGTGKTQFVKGIAEYFKIKKTVNSSTFVLIKSYKISNYKNIKNLIHIDCYRLQSSDELLNLGFQEMLDNKKNILLIEWADKIKDILPKSVNLINFKYGKKQDERKIIF